MPHVMVTIKPDGSKETVVQDKKFTLAQLQAAVGGYIEQLGAFGTWHWHDDAKPRRCSAYVDEEGLIKRSPPALNPTATSYWAIASGRRQQFIVGNLVVVYQV